MMLISWVSGIKVRNFLSDVSRIFSAERHFARREQRTLRWLHLEKKRNPWSVAWFSRKFPPGLLEIQGELLGILPRVLVIQIL